MNIVNMMRMIDDVMSRNASELANTRNVLEKWRRRFQIPMTNTTFKMRNSVSSSNGRARSCINISKSIDGYLPLTILKIRVFVITPLIIIKN